MKNSFEKLVKSVFQDVAGRGYGTGDDLKNIFEYLVKNFGLTYQQLMESKYEK